MQTSLRAHIKKMSRRLAPSIGSLVTLVQASTLVMLEDPEGQSSSHRIGDSRHERVLVLETRHGLRFSGWNDDILLLRVMDVAGRQGWVSEYYIKWSLT